MYEAAIDTAFQLHRRGQDGEDKAYRVKAKRKIVTELGTIEAGEIGYVPEYWIRRILSDACSCNGSINWITFV